MSIGWFTDRKVRPTENEVETSLGAALPNWKLLQTNLHEHYAVQEELKYCYGRKYGWAYQFRRKGKLLVALYPNKDRFVVQIIVSRENLEDATGLHLHSSALEAIESATEYSEGKWLFISVKDANDLKDIMELVEIKSSARKAE